MQDFFTYIIYSQKLDKFYIGSTNDLERRLADHNRGKTSFAKNGLPWVLKYFERFPERALAVKRELEIKRKKNRKYIESLIAKSGSEHPG